MYPAWFDLHDDPVIVANPTAIRLYAKLVTLARIFSDPREVKAWVMAEALSADQGSVNDAFDLLIARGYVVLHGAKKSNAPRRVTVAFARPIAAD